MKGGASPSTNPQVLQSDLAQAIDYHRRGQWADAEQIYRVILTREPRHFEEVALLGTIFLEHSKFDAAAEQFKLAIRIKPEMPLAHAQLGLALTELGQLEAALASYDRAIALKPD